jgi:hypothetical protein
MSVVYCEGVGWASLLAFWTNDIGEDGVDISVSGGGGAGDLTVVAAEMIHNGLGVGITQRHVIGGANAIMGVSADPAVFALPAVPGTMGHTIAAPGLVQQHSLIAVAAEMIHTADSAVQGVVIAALNATQGHTADAVTDIEEVAGGTPVTPVFADMLHTATPVVLVKNLVNVNTSQGHTADTGDIHENKIIPVAGTMGHEAGRIN